MTTFNTNSLGNVSNGNALVFTKATWAGTFAHQPHLLVEEVVWTIAPQVSTASLQWRYGTTVYQPGQTPAAAGTVAAYSARGYYVLILVPVSGGYLPWLGYADNPITLDEDNVSGVQRIPCYGFDRALQYSFIDSTVHVDPADSTAWKRANLGGTFNDNLKGNRSATQVKLDPADAAASVYAFENPGADTHDWWSTRDIVQHLATFHLPTASSIAGTIPWRVQGYTRLPAWDQPQLKTEGRSVHDCLTELAGSDRLLGWKVVPQVTATDPLGTTPTVTNVDIEFFTRASAAITLPDVTNLPANHDLQTWLIGDDRLTDFTIDNDDTSMVDQVIVRGPREVAIGSFRFNDEWVPGYTAAELTEYVDAATGFAGYGALTLLRKREWNENVRAQSKFDHVYRDFPIKDDFDGTVNSGQNLFWKADPADDNYVPYLGNAMFLSELPIFRGVDYSGDVSGVDESNGRNKLPIIVAANHPNFNPGAKYILLSRAFQDAGFPRVRFANSLEYQLDVKPYFDRGPGFQLIVRNGPQHAHRGDNFPANADDPETVNPFMWGTVDSEELIITAAMQGDRRPEVRNPASVSADYVRRKYITLEHPGLLHLHIAADTVVGVDNNNQLITSNGGVLRDPFPILTALAELAGEKFLSPIKTAKITTGRMLNVSPGSLIATINGAAVGAVINEVRIESAVDESDSPPPVRMYITAIDNELDIMNLVARVPVPEVDR